MNLSDAINHFGSKTELAKALNIGRSAISNWGSEIPETRQYQIQILTKDKLKAEPKQVCKAA